MAKSKKRADAGSKRGDPVARRGAASGPPPAKPAPPSKPAPPPKTAPPAKPAPTPSPTPGVPGVRPIDPATRRKQLHRDMLRSIVTEPLLSKVQANPQGSFDVIVSLNEYFKGGVSAALELAKERARAWGVTWATVSNYCFARLSGERILALAAETREAAKDGVDAPAIYRIWEDADIEPTLTRTLTTVKADAAHRAFRALGDRIVWAVLDSGIDGKHPHFKGRRADVGFVDTLDCPAPVRHMDFTPAAAQGSALVDRFGHGTHVAGIIAGCWETSGGKYEPVVGTEARKEGAGEGDDAAGDDTVPSLQKLARISGVAPLCKLVSLKVIADVDDAESARWQAGRGKVSWVLTAIEQIQEWNQHGKRICVHGVNLSLGYDFDARWFGCGQSPICIEVDRLVRSGVCVVVAAGNSGYTPLDYLPSHYAGISINDPGNAELAITVGSTHREMPHVYGVSYFSSRGPTGDGRRKPDLLAPGERIWSCAAGAEKDKYKGLAGARVLYCEQTGTSMAAPHVSGAIAAFLSVRREFVGRPERVKALLMQNAIDLGRDPGFQGAGLLDLMKVLQAV